MHEVVKTADGATVARIPSDDTFAQGAAVIQPTFSARLFGDSFALGTGATTAATEGFANALRNGTKWPLEVFGYSGGELPDIVTGVLSLATESNGRAALQVGFNDQRRTGGSVAGLAYFRRSLRAALAWLALLPGDKTMANSSGVATSGTWTAGTAYASQIARRTSTAQNATLTVTLNGSAIYVGYTNRAGAADGGTFTVTVDSVVRATIDTNVGNSPINSALTTWPELVRVGGLSEGPHTVVVTVTSSSGTVNIDWFGSNANAAGAERPLVFSAGPMRMNSAGYALSSPNFSNGTNAGVAAYLQSHRSVIDEFAADGLGVFDVDASSSYNPDVSANVNADNIHPSTAGHATIGAAFIQRINGVLSAPERDYSTRAEAAAHATSAQTGNITIHARTGSVVFADGSNSLVLTNRFIRFDPLSVILLSVHGPQGGAGVNPRYQISADGAATISLGTANSGAVLRVAFHVL